MSPQVWGKKLILYLLETWDLPVSVELCQAEETTSTSFLLSKGKCLLTVNRKTF